MDAVGKVYGYEGETEGMSHEQRLACHQEKSWPVMKELKERVEGQFSDRQVEPNSNLGNALRYWLSHFSRKGRLSLFQLLLTRQALLPIPAGSWLLDRRLRCVELPFFDFVCQLDSAQCHFRIPKYLEPQHRVTPLLHLPVILLNHVIQVLAGPDER
jgi:hypothetical protein